MATKHNISSDKIYHYIIQCITEGKLKPNDRIKEQDLVKETGLSRTPIREALNILLNEGMLTQDSKNGLIITELDLNAITKLYELREILEGECAKLAAQHASNTEIDILSELVQAQTTLTDTNMIKANNILFHETLYRCSCNRFLIKMMQEMKRSLLLLGESTLSNKSRQKQSYEEHYEMVSALQKRDSAKAQEYAKLHIRNAYKVRLSRLLNSKNVHIHAK